MGGQAASTNKPDASQPEIPAQAASATVESKPAEVPVVTEPVVTKPESKKLEAEKPAEKAPSTPGVAVLAEAEAKKKSEEEIRAAKVADEAAQAAAKKAAIDAAAAAKKAAEAAAEAAKQREIALARKAAREISEKELRAKLLLNQTVTHEALKQVTEADRLHTTHLTGNRTHAMVVHPVGPLGMRDPDHQPTNAVWSNDLDTANCVVDGVKSKEPTCGYFKGNWEAGTGFHFTFQKPVVLDAIRLHQQHCCGRDLFGMYGISNDGKTRVLLGNFTIPQVAMADKRTACGEHVFTVTWDNKAKFQRYELSKLSGTESGAPDVYEIEFPTQAELAAAKEEHKEHATVAALLWKDLAEREAEAKRVAEEEAKREKARLEAAAKEAEAAAKEAAKKEATKKEATKKEATKKEEPKKEEPKKEEPKKEEPKKEEAKKEEAKKEATKKEEPKKEEAKEAPKKPDTKKTPPVLEERQMEI